MLKRAFSRVLIIVICIIVFLAVFFLILTLVNPQAEFEYLSLMKNLAVLVSVFTIYFLVRDLLYDFFRRLGFNKQRVIFGAVVLTLGLNFLTVISVMLIKQTGKTYIPIGTVFDYIFNAQPFDGSYGHLKFLAFCATGLLISVFSYINRKSYLE